MPRGRPKKPLMPEIPSALQEASQEARELGLQPHPSNFLLPEYDFLRMQELAKLRGKGITVSDITRLAIHNLFKGLDGETSTTIAADAVLRLEFEAGRIARRAAYDQ